MSEPFRPNLLRKPPSQCNAPTAPLRRRQKPFTDIIETQNASVIDLDFFHHLDHIRYRLRFLFWRPSRLFVLDAIVTALSDQPDAARFLYAAYDFVSPPTKETDTCSSELKQAVIVYAVSILHSIPEQFFVRYSVADNLRQKINVTAITIILLTSLAFFTMLAFCLGLFSLGGRLAALLPIDSVDVQNQSVQTVSIRPIDAAKNAETKQPETVLEAMFVTEADRRFVTSLRQLLRETQSLFARTAGKPVMSLTESQQAQLLHLETEQLRLCRVFSDETKKMPEDPISEKRILYQSVEPLLSRTVTVIKQNQLGNALFLQSAVLRRLGFDPMSDDFVRLDNQSEYRNTNIVSETDLANEWRDDVSWDDPQDSAAMNAESHTDPSSRTSPAFGPAGGTSDSDERAEASGPLPHVLKQWHDRHRTQKSMEPYQNERMILEYQDAAKKYYQSLR